MVVVIDSLFIAVGVPLCVLIQLMLNKQVNSSPIYLFQKGPKNQIT